MTTISVTSSGLDTFYFDVCTCFCVNRKFLVAVAFGTLFCVVVVGDFQKLRVGIVPAFPFASCLKPLQCRISSKIFSYFLFHYVYFQNYSSSVHLIIVILWLNSLAI